MRESSQKTNLTLLQVYHWTAINKYGKVVKGDTRAETLEGAKNFILAKGLILSTIQKNRC